MNKRRSCAKCGSAYHHVANCTTYKQDMKSLGYTTSGEWRVTSGELTTKSMKAMTKKRDAGGAERRISLGINYEKAAAEVLNKVKQDLATKEIEQGLKQEIERQQRNETLSIV